MSGGPTLPAMLRSNTLRLLLLAAVAGGLGCSPDRATRPVVARDDAGSPAAQHDRDDDEPPRGRLIACEKRPAAADDALIGPSGGTLEFGGHRLIVPPGALTKKVRITAEVVPNVPVLIVHFEPSGLQFRKPAGLVLNVSGCSIPSSAVPDVVYIEDGRILERIHAVFSRAWRTIAAPISHFSGYSIAL